MKKQLQEVQEKVHLNYFDKELLAQEQVVLQEYRGVRKDYFSFLQQKSRIDWLTVGDENTSFFHRSLRIQAYSKRVIHIQDVQGKWCSGSVDVGKAFEEYYKVLPGSDDGEKMNVDAELVKSGPVVTDEHIALLSFHKGRGEGAVVRLRIKPIDRLIKFMSR